MQKTYDFSVVKQSISIVEFFENVIGAEPVDIAGSGSSRRYGVCPACGLHKHSHRVSVIEKGFNCFSCNAKGDVITAASLFWGIGKAQAAAMLMEGGYTSIYSEGFKPAIPAQKPRDEAAYKELVKSFLEAPKTDERGVYNYLNGRGITDQTIEEGVKRGLIVALPQNPSHASNWLNKYVGQELMLKTKILKEDKRTPGIIYKPLCFIGDNKASIEFRIAGPKQSEHDIKSIRYGLSSPWTWSGKSGVMVTEGVIDLLSAVELGTERTIVAIPGCQSYKVQWFDQYKGQQILLALDSDGPGIDAAHKMKSDLEGCGHTVYIYTLPDGCKDLNDRLMATRSLK